MMNFKGKIAVVTGGTRGIGRSIADKLCERGCRVIRTGTKELDFTDSASVRNFTAGIRKMDRIDILVNNAGINIVEGIDRLSEESWNNVIKVNLTGAALLLKEVSRIMKNSGNGGRIVNVSSIFGIVSRQGRNAYSASKSGLIGLTRSSALDLAPYNILVNALCPGFTQTELTASMLSKKEVTELKGEIPLGRFATVSEIAESAVFLCSSLNSYMTGQVLIADGGYVIR